MHKTRTRLADGRELIYFDSVETERRRRDRRPPGRPAPQGEMRYDATLGEWVAIARHRQDRTFLPPIDGCPLCPSTSGSATEIPAADYEVVVLENRFPSFSGDAATLDGDEVIDSSPFPRRPAAGRCEVVCFTVDHTGSFATLPPARARLIIDVWADRTAELSAMPGVRQVFCFENRGEEIGVTLHHPHGQVYGYPFVAPTMARLIERARSHRRRTGGDLFADLLEAEREAAERLVLGGSHWTAFVPFAAHWPIEVHLMPHRQVADFTDLTTAERDELAVLYQELLRRVDGLFADPVPYIAAWFQAPPAARGDVSLHLRLFSNRRAPGKLKYLAGSEAAMGAFVNDLAPEAMASALRDV